MFKDFFSKISDEKKLVFFFAKLFLIWLSWKAIFFVLGEEHIPLNERLFPALSAYWEALNYKLVRFIVEWSCDVLKALGYKSYTHQRIVWIAGSNGVAIGNYCIGIQLMYYYIMLVLITPLTLLKKAIGVPVGIIITLFFNIVRTSGLCMVSLYAPTYIEFAHDHIFNVLVFGTLMGFYFFLIKEREQITV